MQKISKSIIISGGGTAGHINPALNIAHILSENGWQIYYIGNKSSMEEQLVTRRGYKFYPINIQKIYRKITLAHIKFPFKLIYSILICLKVIKKVSPDAFLGTGGFVSGPAGFAAHLKKVPIFLQEQNSYPGLTTRILSRWAKMIFLGNQNARNYLKNRNTCYTGNPVSSKILDINMDFTAESIGLHSNSQKIFLLGGSLGSLLLNRNLSAIIEKLLAEDIEIIWQTGSYSHKQFNDQYGKVKGVYLFAYTHQIADLYNAADLVIARAGALSLAELETLHKPALLVPLAIAAGNHQYYNARELVEKGSAEMITENDLSPEILFQTAIKMLNNIDKYRDSGTGCSHAEAAKNIAQEIIKHTERR